MLRALTPVVWFVNLFVQALLKLFAIRPAPRRRARQLTQEELRSLVLEGSQYFRGKHKTMLANLMDLEAITVDDVMTPRNQIHALDLAEKPALLRQQLATSYHTRVAGLRGLARQHHRRPAAEGGRAPAAAGAEVDAERLRAAAAPAVLHSGGHAAARPSCSSSRTTGSASGSSSTNTASCRAW